MEAPSYKKSPTIAQQFGARLRELRTERGYIQLQAAEQIGIDRSFLSDVERGVKEMTISNLHRTAVAFSMSLSDLLKGVGTL